MANPLYGSENFSTTLNVGGGINNSQTTGIVLTSVSGLDTGGGILCLDWAATLDTSVAEYIEYGSYSGNTLSGVVRGAEGSSAKAHSNGATVVCVVSKAHINRVADKLRSVDATLSQDQNNNEIIKTSYVASAVNEVTITNAATGNGPSVTATGGDTNIPLVLAGKGTGGVSISGVTQSATAPTAGQVLTASSSSAAAWATPSSNTDGWQSSSDTWVYASATTFTIAGADRTTTFTPGTRLKLTQTTAKYFVVASSSFSTDTTVTITGGTDYTLANAAITSPYYSYQVNPQGYPGWFAYTTTWTGFSVDPTGAMRFSVIGRKCFVAYKDNGAGTSNATTLTFTAPINVSTNSVATGQGICFVKDNGSNQTTPGVMQPNAAGSKVINVFKTFPSGVFTNSGAKDIYFPVFIYEF